MSRDASKDWTLKPLKSLFSLQTPGFWGEEAHGSHDVKVLRATNLTKDNKLNLNRPALRRFPEKKREQKALQNKDIILERSGGSPNQPVGRVGFFEGGQGYSVSNFMQILRIDTNVGIPKFCYYLMVWLYEKGVTEKLQKATTGIRNLDYATYLNTEICIPPLHEQRWIAEMLSSVDEAIAATQAVIEQTNKVKQATLELWFHRGNWSKKQLPKNFTLSKLENINQRGSGHTPSKKNEEYWNGGVNWISLQDTKKLDNRYVMNTAAQISELGIQNSSAYLHPAGTVFVSRDATVGKVGIMKTPMAVSQHFISWTCGPTLNNIYLYYWLQNMKPIFDRVAAGSTIKTIGLTFFKELIIAHPCLTEQELAADRMMAIDDSIEMNEKKTQKLLSLKSALMSDLLTGRKRVTDTLLLAAE